MLIHTTFSTYFYPKIHYTHKLKAVNSSASDKNTTLKDVPFHFQIQKKAKDPLNCNNKLCFCCSRRSFMAAVGAAALLPIHPSLASDDIDSMAMLNRWHPPRPDWYEEFYAAAMNTSMKSYESEVSSYLPLESCRSYFEFVDGERISKRYKSFSFPNFSLPSKYKHQEQK